MDIQNRIADIIKEYRDRLSRDVVEKMFSQNERLKTKYRIHFERLVSDIQFHFDYLAESVRYSSQKLITEYSRWLIVFFRELNIPPHELELTFRLMQAELANVLDEESNRYINCYFNLILKNLTTEYNYSIKSFIETDNPFQDLAKRYFNLLLQHKRREASKLLTDALETGTDIKDIYLYIFQRSQWEIGRLWQTQNLTVAEEHTFTAATQLIMSQLYPYTIKSHHSKGKIIAACVGRELHEIGIRMVADFLEMDGWDTIYVGANTPTETLIQTVVKERPQIIALSTTIIPHIKNMKDIIERIKAERITSNIKIMVGGYPFNNDPNLWKLIGSDGFAPDANQAIYLADKLAG